MFTSQLPTSHSQVTDEAGRREAMVVVPETIKSLMALSRELSIAIAELEAIPGV
ncbi:MAG TPA: hypothetical protein PKN33_03200 [Phycisphaerae bacterium]|nr:hypothetical protein [Phycisphaerae bacterium]